MIFTDVQTDRQKLDVILGTKVVQFWSYQKMYFTKNVVLDWYSSMKFFFRKIQMLFEIEKWLWKSDLGTFWRPMWICVKVKSKKYFYFTDFFSSSKLIFVSFFYMHVYYIMIKSSQKFWVVYVCYRFIPEQCSLPCSLSLIKHVPRYVVSKY